MNEFNTCPAQYAAKRYFKTVKDPGNKWTKEGSEIHSALEHRLKGRALAKKYQPYEKYCVAMENAKGLVEAEQEIAFDRDLNITSWFAKNTWGRSKLDVTIDYGNKVAIYDWKSGKVKDDPLQLQIFAAVASLVYPNAEEFICKNIWLKYDEITGDTYHRDQVPQIMEGIMRDVGRMEKAWETETFVCRTSGLCRGWCLNKACEHWEPKR
jgi:hypothetical protein